ncbi:MAG TPA: transposase [Candidatus Dormibacteraeota bacterium]|nr:transposase [Candidatus Dormibacteraeota bacterium]
MIGIDSHKENLAACAIDELGGKLAEAVFPNTATGHRSLLGWARGLDSVRRIGIEGTGQYGRAVANALVQAGVEVVEVPSALTAREPNRLRQPDKSDLGDALAIARVTAREARLPVPAPAGRHADLRLLLTYRHRRRCRAEWHRLESHRRRRPSGSSLDPG